MDKKKKISYSVLKRSYSLIFIPMALLPFIGIALYASGVGMFLLCLVVYLIDICLYSIFIDFPNQRNTQNITIDADDIKIAVCKENKWRFLNITSLIIIGILNFFPFFATSEKLMSTLFSMTYSECYDISNAGGTLIFFAALFMLIANVCTIHSLYFNPTQIEDNIFNINKTLAKTGKTPSQLRTQKMNQELKKGQEKQQKLIQSEKALYGEDYSVVCRTYGGIFINERNQKIFIRQKEYGFKDILGVSLKDNSTTVDTGFTTTLKTNTGSLVGRAIVGKIIAGNTGAIIGGTTAKKTIDSSERKSYESHDYSILINIDSLYSPTITLRTGDDTDATNHIVAVLNVIVHRNQENNEM